MISEQVTDEEYGDSLAFRRMHEDEAMWSALTRLVGRIDLDLIQQWTDDQTGERSKKWLKGAREMCGGFLPRISEMIQIAEAVIEEKVIRSPAEEGGGSGDIAL